jgi:hypothetical protein
MCHNEQAVKLHDDLCLAEQESLKFLTVFKTNFFIIQKLTAQFYGISCFYFVPKNSIFFRTFAKIL